MLGMHLNHSYSQDFEGVINQMISISQREFTDGELEYLQERLIHPLNLNAISEDDLKQLLFLSEFEQKSLWDYILKNRPLRTVYELQLVLGLSIEKAQLLSSFCYVSNIKTSKTFQELLEQGNHSVSTSVSFPKLSFHDYSETYTYSGNPIKEVVRYRYQSYNKLYWGFTLKKDAGEKGSFQNAGMFDYQSIYVQIKDQGNFTNTVFGDYQMQIGQGLTMWQGGFYGKSLEQAGGYSLCELSKHSSSNEFQYLRGIASNIKLSHFTISPFISFRKIDGKLKQDSIDFPLQIYSTGYHRSCSEQLNEQKIGYNLYGMHVQYKIQNLRMGVAGVYHKFAIDSSVVILQNYSFSYNYRNKGFRLFGEAAIDKNLNIATTNGMQSYVTNDVLFTCIYRFYSPSYQSFMAKSFGEQSSVQNETGLYSRFEISLLPNLTFFCAHDVFYMPYERYFVKAPTRGNELSAKLQYSSFSGFTAYYNWSYESKTDAIYEGALKQTAQRTKNFHKVYCNIPIHEKISIKIGLLYTTCKKTEISKGILLYQDLVVKPIESVTISLRYAQFNAPYEARLYAWEDNVSYSFSSSQYFYDGTQWYVIAKWKVTPKIQVQTKISKSQLSNLYALSETYDLYENRNKLIYNFFVSWEF